MPDRPILVIGAGELGLAILRALSTHPARPAISVLLRPSASPSRAGLISQLEALKASIIPGDLGAPMTELASILKPFHTIISATGFASGSGTQLKLAQAVLEAKIKWYFPCQFGVDYDLIGRGSSQPLFDEQLDVRDLLRSQTETETEWTIVSTGIFTSFLFDPAFGVVDMYDDKAQKEVTVTALGAWESGLTCTSAEDIGRATAHIVCETGDKGVVYIAGDSVTFADLADAYTRRGWKVDKGLITVQELEEARRERPDDLGPKYGLVWARDVGVQWDKAGTYNVKHGIDFEDMGQWMDRNL